MLGVSPDASPEAIRGAYRDLCKRVHPDVGGNAALFGFIQDAYDTLSDATRRAEYDRLRQAGPSRPDPPRPRPEPQAVWVEPRPPWGLRIAVGLAALVAVGAIADTIENREPREVVSAAAASPAPAVATVVAPSPRPVYKAPAQVATEPVQADDADDLDDAIQVRFAQGWRAGCTEIASQPRDSGFLVPFSDCMALLERTDVATLEDAAGFGAFWPKLR